MTTPDRTLSFVLVDLTTDATAADMKPAAEFDAMIDAWIEQVGNDFQPAHGSPCVAFRVASSPTDRQAGEIAINFRDSIPEAPGALAYHTVTNGIADIEIGVDLFSSLTSGTESVSSGVSHEILETLGDEGANEWADKDDGSNLTGAREVCDPVQNTGYETSNGVAVSNFVLPSYFVPGALAPWDHLGVMTAQNDIAAHGYEIQAQAVSETTQVGGDIKAIRFKKSISIAGSLTAEQAKRKRHPYSRAYRRGARV